MNLRQKVSLVFLFLGLIFSSIIRIRFNISQGFEFQNVWVTWIPAMVDLALINSREHALTSTFLGYIFYVGAGFLLLKNLKNSGHKNNRLTVFLAVSAFALGFELISVAQDLFTSYYGQQFHIGLALFIFGMIVFYQTSRLSKNMSAFHDH